jgi:hypothetical protein
MYYPILRGKQFELIALRELAPILNPLHFSPIIEPVRNSFSPLINTIKTLNLNGITPVIIINPSMGDFDEQNCSETIAPNLLLVEGEPALRYIPCINTKNITTVQIEALIEETGDYAIFIEEGLNREHIPILSKADLVIAKTYQRRAFRGLENIVIIDANSFKKQKRNSDYKDESFFTDIHTSYSEHTGVIGFGDYTITGDDFTESGGPAYVVTIHLSYTKPEEFDDMYVRHFKSFDNSSPTQPGEKFGDALRKLISFADQNDEVLYSTIGLQGYYTLHQAGHFPGLGQVKKLSIQHHIETLCSFLGDENE